MEHEILNYPKNKDELYPLLLEQMEALIEGETHYLPVLANASALLGEALRDVNWVGFYLMVKDELLLGPFQGRVACTHIQLGRGVCGMAAAEDKIQVIKDVHAFPGHIACDSASNSEIVIPLHNGETVTGVLDIDSPLFGRFDEKDALGLEKIARAVERAIDWQTL